MMAATRKLQCLHILGGMSGAQWPAAEHCAFPVPLEDSSLLGKEDSQF